MHEDQGRPVGLFLKTGGQPGQTPGAHLAVTVARHKRVESDQPQRMRVDGVVQEAVAVVEIAVARELGEKFAPAVVIARHQIVRHG